MDFEFHDIYGLYRKYRASVVTEQLCHHLTYELLCCKQADAIQKRQKLAKPGNPVYVTVNMDYDEQWEILEYNEIMDEQWEVIEGLEMTETVNTYDCASNILTDITEILPGEEDAKMISSSTITLMAMAMGFSAPDQVDGM